MDRQIHAGQANGGGNLLVAVECHAVGSIELAAFEEVAGLDEHAAGAAGRVENYAVVGLDDVDNGLDQGRRSEKLAVILRALHGELHEEVFVDAAEHVARGAAQSFAIEDAKQVFEDIRFEVAIVLGELAGKGLDRKSTRL